MVSETKTDDSFPLTQFLIEGFTAPYRLDWNWSGGGILVYIREDIPSKLIPTDFSNREGFFLELNFRKKKWVLCCSYNPQYRNYKKFSNDDDAFRSELVIENGNLQNLNNLDSLLAKCKNFWIERHLLSKSMLELITVHLLTKLFSRQLWNEQDWKINLLSIDVKETKEPIMHKETCAFL